MGMKLSISSLLEGTDCKIETRKLFGEDHFALIDEDGDVVLYEGIRGQNDPFGDVEFIVSPTETPEGTYHSITAVII